MNSRSVPESTEAQDDRAFRIYRHEDMDCGRREREEAAIDARIERDREDSERLLEHTVQANNIIMMEFWKGVK
jgi:hypothetical protein